MRYTLPVASFGGSPIKTSPNPLLDCCTYKTVHEGCGERRPSREKQTLDILARRPLSLLLVIGAGSPRDFSCSASGWSLQRGTPLGLRRILPFSLVLFVCVLIWVSSWSGMFPSGCVRGELVTWLRPAPPTSGLLWGLGCVVFLAQNPNPGDPRNERSLFGTCRSGK